MLVDLDNLILLGGNGDTDRQQQQAAEREVVSLLAPADEQPGKLRIDRLAAAGLKKTLADKLLTAWVHQHLDTVDRFNKVAQWGTPNSVLLARRRGERIRIPKLTQTDICLHRHGKARLSCRPAYRSDPELGIAPTTVLRIDIDAHAGQADAEAMAKRINADLFDGRLYDEPSPRGWSLYAVVELPMYTRKRVCNEVVKRLEQTLQAWRLARGYSSTVEVAGGYLIIRDSEIVDAPRRVALPICKTEADVNRLIDTRRIYLDDVEQVIGKLSHLLLDEPKQDTQPRRASRPRGTLSRVIVEDTGDKHRNRAICMGFARQRIIGWRTTPTQDEWARAIDEADAIYVYNGLATGERDRERDQAFDAILTRLLRDTESTASNASDREPWIDFATDVDRAEQIIRSKLPKRRLARIHNGHSGLRRAKLTYRLLALVLVADAKNAERNPHGATPTACTLGLLRWAGTKLNWTQLRIARLIIEQLGLMRMTDSTYHTGRSQRRVIAGATERLPFIVAWREKSCDAAQRPAPAPKPHTSDEQATERGGTISDLSSAQHVVDEPVWGSLDWLISSADCADLGRCEPSIAENRPRAA